MAFRVISQVLLEMENKVVLHEVWEKGIYEQAKQIHPLCAFSCWHLACTDSQNPRFGVPGMHIQGCCATPRFLFPHSVWMGGDGAICSSPAPSAAPLKPKPKDRKVPKAAPAPGSQGQSRALGSLHHPRAAAPHCTSHCCSLGRIIN